MDKLITNDLLEIYNKALELNLEKEFINLLESELIKRDLFRFIMFQNVS